mmetsp:Transcript_24540/g.47086  ORF Transcript_24540/g.47086 Transcript_24540/m.47086 type:complete len:90 (-) Transcript_24540:587-856(-)
MIQKPCGQIHHHMLIPTDLDGVRAGCGFGIGHARSGGEFIPDGLRGDDDGAFGMRAGGEDSPLIVWLFFHLDMSSGSLLDCLPWNAINE